MKLPLPLHKYDENGRVKPPLMLMLSLVFLARSIVVFIASLSFREDGGLLLSLFYPDKYQFYLSLSSAIPALVLIFVIGFREKIWKAGKAKLFYVLPWFIGIVLCVDILLQLYIVTKLHFQFSWPSALSLLVTMLIVWYLFLSANVKVLIKDWPLKE
ncbi:MULTISPECIES: DUF2919 domain-containing protein [Alteromonadaceae]|jgi:hypothetical protein|uniref:DUF2919 domain-containing protein n=1 Tax=Brumicola blandensis TaxID=3075611 RepID=A0AAW8QXL6_9ALTE|nr:MULTISPECIES: DUF2919 domain-containing protein [unclassified Alteromonas]MDT0581746.1 DUF2919 domain-containing protein [Alteromonas sp. W409]MDT0629796.1 DUF2919 domain-containing protein [Alteromonas sp. W364]